MEHACSLYAKTCEVTTVDHTVVVNYISTLVMSCRCKGFQSRLAVGARALLLAVSGTFVIFGQITTGIVEGTVQDAADHAQTGVVITAIGPVSTSWSVKSGVEGTFELILPYGDYEIEAGREHAIQGHIQPRKVTYVSLTSNSVLTTGAAPDLWRAWSPQFAGIPGPYGLAGTLLIEEPAIVTEPLDFTGVENTRIPLVSRRSFSWTATEFSLAGMNATDPYQPGRPVVFPDVSSLDEMTVESTSLSGIPANFGAEIGVFTTAPGSHWHGTLTSSGTGAPLASSNLPGPAARGTLQQPKQYNWFTRDHVDLGGPLWSRADMYFSGTGQWGSETVPIAPPGQNQKSRLLFGNFGMRYRLTTKDQIDFFLSGSRINVSNFGEPVDLEALTGWRMMPAYETTYGFNRLAEVDHLDFIQGGWTKQLPESFRSGVLQVRYSASIAHLDTEPAKGNGGQSLTELLGATVTGMPPLANFAVRQRQSVRAVLQPGDVSLFGKRNKIVAGGAWERSNMQNRLTAPSDLHLITAGGLPAYAVQLNTPVDSRDRVQSFSAFVRDEIRLARWFSVDAGVVGEFSQGSLPAQGSPAGAFIPARDFPGRADVIVWNTAGLHAGFTLKVPGSARFLLGGSYTRLYAPLAGQYLDFANPNSLSGTVFSWNDVNRDRVFEPGELGTLLRRFGGVYSSASPSLDSPHADEFDLYGEDSLNAHASARIQLFRRDDKDRIVGMDTGIPATAYQPISILDPGPDGIPGTFDDRFLTVYQQNPATFGHDRFLLENQRNLRMLFEGLTAEVSATYGSLNLHASFTAEKSFGPTNPGNSVIENDSGIVGALYQDPNTLINGTGHDFFDRSFLGKIQMTYQLPLKFGGIELLNVTNYLDGLPFARELLATGLAQGPIVVPATIRGSPEGGNRAQYALNWNLRLARTFSLPAGRMRFSVDLLNVTNSGNRIQEDDITGVHFNQRLPVAIQAPRSIRFAVQYAF